MLVLAAIFFWWFTFGHRVQIQCQYLTSSHTSISSRRSFRVAEDRQGRFLTCHIYELGRLKNCPTYLPPLISLRYHLEHQVAPDYRIDGNPTRPDVLLSRQIQNRSKNQNPKRE
jgi:hypothetical protein